MSLAFSTNQADGIRVIAVSGEVDVSNADLLRDELDAVLEAGDVAVAVDLAQVPYIDSTGIGVLVGAAHRASEKGLGFSVRNPQRNVSRVLGLLGVDDQLGVSE